jgi:hypothetical protein
MKTVSTSHGYDLFIDPRSDYIFAQLRAAVIKPDVYHAVLPEIRDVVLENRIARLMFEFDAGDPLSDDETYEFINELITKMRGMRIALVARHDKHLQSLRFAEALGAYTDRQLRSFTKEADAEKWLLED